MCSNILQRGTCCYTSLYLSLFGCAQCFVSTFVLSFLFLIGLVLISGGKGFSLPEKTAIDKEIGGYYVPSGTSIVIDWKRLNTSPSVWGEDSEVFRPERFVGLSPTSYRHAFLRFGFSHERCLGKNISEIILKTILIATLESYVLKPSKHSAVRKGRFTVIPDDEVEFAPITVA